MAKVVIRNLTKTYSGGAVVALQDINLEIEPQESLCVLGPSGCGKTTLLRIIDCLISRDCGEVTMDGSVVTQPRPDVAVVFQHFGLFPWKRLDQNIAYGLELRGTSKPEIATTVAHYLDLMGLNDFAKSYPHQLSGGMQQRAGLARALAINPSLMLMDEPFGALDEQTRIILGEELLRIRDQLKQTIILVTHNINESVQLSNRVMVMTASPGRVKSVVDVDLPQPRDSSIIASDRFGKLVAQVWGALREESIKSFKQSEQRT